MIVNDGMKRRPFLKWIGAAAITAPLWTAQTSRGEATTAPELRKKWAAELDRSLADWLSRQEKNRSHRWFGGVMDLYGIHAAPETAVFIRTLATVFAEPASTYYRSDKLLQPLHNAVRYMLQVQHPDGAIDLHTTNFDSPPDTGFVVEHLTLAYTVLAMEKEAALESLLLDLRRFLVNAGRILSSGGIHTPNHRWVICMALARLQALFPDPAYLARIEQWLREKIDVDPDGQFNERSSSIYSPLTDRCLITIARLLNRPELLEPVRRNLNMTLYFVHPDGEVVTEASRRQDQYQRGSMARYYYPYRYLALHDANGEFAAMARWIETTSMDKLAQELIFFQEDPDLGRDMAAGKPLPENYRRLFAWSHLARIRRRQVSATVLARNSIFFTFHKGAAALEGMRFAAAFFGKGQFVGEELREENGVFIMTHSMEGPYYQPYPVEELPADGDWEKMDRGKRPRSQVQHLTSRVEISEKEGVCSISITITGTDRVPVAVELGFRKGGQLEQVTPLAADTYLLAAGTGRYSYAGQTIQFGPGLAEHRWTQIRGSQPKLDALSVYLTGYTPFRHELVVQ